MLVQIARGLLDVSIGRTRDLAIVRANISSFFPSRFLPEVFCVPVRYLFISKCTHVHFSMGTPKLRAEMSKMMVPEGRFSLRFRAVRRRGAG